MKKGIFNKNYDETEDRELIKRSVEGDKNSLLKLIEKHQGYIYNVSLKMLNNIQEAEDTTQDILIKLITNLTNYDPEKASLRTWLYRITSNHIINLKKSSYEKKISRFNDFFDIIDTADTIELDPLEIEELNTEIEEAKIACTAGMLMCLEREQRFIYIVGEIFEIDHRLGADIFQITPVNFRKKLSRAKENLYHWMDKKCGLVNKSNPCRCPKKTKGFIAKGWVDPNNLKWQSNFSEKIYQLAATKLDSILESRDEIYANIYRNHPAKTSMKAQEIIDEILKNNEYTKYLNL